MRIHKIILGGEHPWSAAVRIERSVEVEHPTWSGELDQYFRWPILLVPAGLWDLLESGLGMRENTIRCSKCRLFEHLDSWIESARARMLEYKLCLNCSLWREHAERANDSVSVRVDGSHYRIGPEPAEHERGWGCGFGGRRFRIRYFDGRYAVTHNLWFQGEIPELWRDQLPDNAEFLE